MALLFRENTKQCLSSFVVTMLGMLNLVVANMATQTPTILCLVVHQTYILDIHRPENCQDKFTSIAIIHGFNKDCRWELVESKEDRRNKP